jgi:hypothetical protein
VFHVKHRNARRSRHLAAGDDRHRSISLAYRSLCSTQIPQISLPAKPELNRHLNATHAHHNDMHLSSSPRSEASFQGGESIHTGKKHPGPESAARILEAPPNIRAASAASVVTAHFGCADASLTGRLTAPGRQIASPICRMRHPYPPESLMMPSTSLPGLHHYSPDSFDSQY